MALRIVSGVLFTTTNNGSVTIELKSNSIVAGAGNADIWYGNEFGGNTHYDKEPCYNISVRAFTGHPISIDISGPSFSGPTTGYENVTIYWNSNGGTLKEISYIFAGEE